jgi:hypothetical protein
MSKNLNQAKKLDRVDYDYKLDLYRQRSKELAAKAQGLERYMYELFGSDLMASWALALDPWEHFTFTRYKIAPVNRTRKIQGIANLVRKVHYKQWTRSTGYTPNLDTSYPFDYYYTGPKTTVNSEGSQGLTAQAICTGFIKDTTKRTRPIGTILGEFEMFAPSWHCSGGSFNDLVLDNINIATTGTGVQKTTTKRHSQVDANTTGLRVSSPDVTAMATVAQSRALSVMAKNALGMLDKCLPTSRLYNLAYQISELKDLPQTIQGTLKIWVDFSNHIGPLVFKDLLRSPKRWNVNIANLYRLYFPKGSIKLDTDKAIADAYLTFKFGWQSMVSAVEQLLPKPAEIAKQVNRIIDGIGKDLTFRTKRKWTEPLDSIPGFTGEIYQFENLDQTGSSAIADGYREVELRCVVNVAVRFPKVDIPSLRRSLYVKKIGADPLPGDIYDIVPWSWLIDWFGGLGDYIHIMDTVRGDRSLVNFAFMTYRSIDHIHASFRTYTSGSSTKVLDDGTFTSSWKNRHNRSGNLLVKYHLRKSIASVASVSNYSAPLSATQTAILGALATKYSGSGKKP